MSGKDIPVYICDSVLTPESWRTQKRPIEHQKDIPVPSAQKEFWIPEEIVDKGKLYELCRLLEHCIKTKYDGNDFISLSQPQLKWEDPLTERSLLKLYKKIQRLEEKGRNGLWTRLIKNSFAPVFCTVTPFDYVIGNPPWVNWESLADEYRDVTGVLWQHYGLIPKASGIALGRTKKDIAMLFVAVSVDRYLADTGKLSLLIPFTLFKSQAGSGFRKFLACKTQVEQVHDMVELAPFEGAINRTALITLRKGKASFPVPCVSWSKRQGGKIDTELTIDQVKLLTKQSEMILEPIEGEARPESPWLMLRARARDAVKKVMGQSKYKAYEGINTSLNGAYWVEIISKRSEGLRVRNLATVGKKKVTTVEETVESDLVYPLIRGQDVRMWYGKPSAYMVVPSDASGCILPPSNLRVDYPGAWAYFNPLFDDLIHRNGEPYKSKLELYRKGKSQDAELLAPPFYWLFNLTAALKAYKVVWKEIAGKISGKGQFSVAVIPPFFVEAV
jgi:hypothetical protein